MSSTTTDRHGEHARHEGDHRPSRLARTTGVAYLGIIVTGVFAEFAVRGSLVTDDDAIATAGDIARSPGLFGVGIAADVVMIALDVVVGIGLFRLLAHVNRRMALGAMVLRLVQGAVLAANLANLFLALAHAREAAAGDVLLAGPAGSALDAVERHALGYDAGLVAFGLSCLVLGRLLWTSRAVSRPMAIGMAATGVVYLAGSTAALFASGLSPAIEPLYVVPLVVEIAFAVRLVSRGLGGPARSPAPARPAPVVA